MTQIIWPETLSIPTLERNTLIHSNSRTFALDHLLKFRVTTRIRAQCCPSSASAPFSPFICISQRERGTRQRGTCPKPRAPRGWIRQGTWWPGPRGCCERESAGKDIMRKETSFFSGKQRHFPNQKSKIGVFVYLYNNISFLIIIPDEIFPWTLSTWRHLVARFLMGLRSPIWPVTVS